MSSMGYAAGDNGKYDLATAQQKCDAHGAVCAAVSCSGTQCTVRGSTTLTAKGTMTSYLKTCSVATADAAAAVLPGGSNATSNNDTSSGNETTADGDATPAVDTGELAIVLSKLDNVTAKVDVLEGKLFNSTLLISGIEGDTGKYGLEVGDYDNEAIPFEFLLHNVHMNVTNLAGDSVRTENTIKTDRADVQKDLAMVREVGKRAEESGDQTELVNNVTSSLAHVRKAVESTNPKIGPLLGRVDAVATAFRHALEAGHNATTGIGGRAVRAGFDRLRASIRRAGALALHHGIPDELQPEHVVENIVEWVPNTTADNVDNNTA